MRTSLISAAFLALASAVFAQQATDGFDAITSPAAQDQDIPAGAPFDIVWQPGTYTTGTATITLLQGADPSTLQAGQNITTNVENNAGKFTWDIPKDLPYYKTYGFKITLNGSKDPVIFQYSFPFHITGLSSASGSSTASASGGTVTVKISTGTNYTPSPTLTAVNSTTAYNTTTSMSAKPTSNVTLSTTLTSARTTVASTTAASRTSAAPSQQTTNAAIANAATGGIALIGGLFLAMAL